MLWEILKKYNDSEERLREFYSLLLIADKQRLKELIEADKKKEEQKKGLQRNFVKVKTSQIKQYNLCEAAKILDVHRQTLYYWMKKGWIKPKRDYRNYPIFTVLDIETIKKWRKTGAK